MEEVEVPEYYREEEDDEDEGGEEEDGGGKEFYEFQPLPTLLEDERSVIIRPSPSIWQHTSRKSKQVRLFLKENVSLADILSLRDNCLTEQDIWAICLECCYSMKDISHAAIFQTLCITPDTLAFNTSGNVCFMEQLSDDPEGAFVPPEFDLTGNTIEGHIYSLGATLKAAIEFVVDPDSETEFCQDLSSLLDSMQQENPADRPDIESIISLCEEKINCSSSSVCRSLSSIGRRVLSIESVTAFQDGWESLWKGVNKKDNCMKVPTTEKAPSRISTIPENCSVSLTGFSLSSNSVQEEEHQNGWREVEFKLEKPCSPPNSFGHHLKKNKRERSKSSSPEKFEGFERAKVEDEMAKLSLKRHRRNKHSSLVNNVEKRSLSQSPPGVGLVTLKSWPSVPSCLSPNEEQDSGDGHGNQTSLPVPNHTNCVSPLGQSKCHSQISYENLVTALEQENQHFFGTDRNAISKKYTTVEDPVLDSIRLNIKQHNTAKETFGSAPIYREDVLSMSRHLNSPETDPDFCDGYESIAVNENQRWVSLKEMLLNYGKPLQEDELWALCYECLYTLQTYVDYPAILSLESVFIDQCGEVLFVTHQNEEPYDAFCVPPEHDPDGDGSGTEKTCVYGIAAILWSAAKFNYVANHKLTLPKKLKWFLLQMAKRDSDERPSLAEALQVCRKYLEQKNLDSKAMWTGLISLMDQNVQSSLYPEEDSHQVSGSTAGFVPVTTHKKLTAVKGPVPLKDQPVNLPAAYTSPATYFKPIVIMQNTDINSNKIPSPSPYPKPQVSPGDMDHIEENISVTEMENHVEEDKTSQLLKSGSRTKVSFKTDFNVLDYDRKEKSPSALSSVSSNSSTLTSSPIVNNYLLKQDPKTGNLTLVRVQLSIPEHILSVSLEAEPASQTIKSSPVHPPATFTNTNVVSNDHESSRTPPTASSDKCKETQGSPTMNGVLGNNCEKKQDSPSSNTSHETLVNGESPSRRNVCTPLQKVVNLLQEEFAFDGYLENGVEDIAMGEYIFALKGLQHTTFCSAICEKFCDLYWDDHLLENLYKIINNKSPPPVRKTVTDSSLNNNPTQLLKKIQRKTHKKQTRPTTNEQSVLSDGEEAMASTTHVAAEQDSPPKSHYSLSPEDIDTTMETKPPGPETQVAAGRGSRPSYDETDMTDSPSHMMDKHQQPRAPRTQAGSEENCEYRAFPDCNSLCVSPDYSEENEEVKQRESMSICPSEVYKCSSGWSSAFYGAEMFDPDVQHYVTILGRQKEKSSKSMEAKRLELEQQLMIETKNYRKTVKLYQNLMLKGKRSKGSDVKELLPKLKGHLEEMKSKVQFLELAKKLLQVSYAEQWGLESRELPTVANLASLSSSENDAFVLMYNEKGHKRDHTSKNLQAGTPLGLLVHLYSRNAVVDGYVQQFFYAFRYVCSQEDLLRFLVDRINNTLPRDDMDPSSMDAKMYHRSLVLLQSWIEECWHIDFSMNPDLLDKLEDLSNSQILPKDERDEYLVSLLQELCCKKYTISSPTSSSEKKEDTKSLHSLCTKFSEDNVSRKSFNWRLSKGNGLHLPHHRDKQYTISAALPRPCYPGLVEDLSSYYIKGEDCGTYSIHECSVQQIATQLTLLQEEMFQKCHPVNFLNSRAIGVKDKSSNVPKTFSMEPLPVEVCSLFSSNCVQDKYLLHMLRFTDNVSTWVAAEIVTCHTSKLQTSILTKFLLVAKLCYEQRDFATAVQILGGLENLIVRQLPAWKNLPTKVAEILEELKAVEVFLKSDSLCLMKGDRFRTLPTIPSAYLLAMHIQQLETGGFTMANGAFKWNKLRNIAKVVSQVHAFQEIPYSFTPDPDLQFYLRQRISHFNDADISVLAADNNANFHHVNSEKHSRKIQDTLRRMKATFQ
ncbi:LOW QUALITY PROTEIN: kinase non-catalytic C-lobe domain-containing protein 1 [Bufo gargarizans]|uniref:LOW QUALITY PROTEIN: kinase non-catalytic C-lobe domain-containing protein 1 n=1 Tax=Bufo gargarizans TaxID=30331 RepID=UPI001CF57515|nr:LOW QUALITY PROTEIN: kinase non-catalytic C-lobe domain-containing protein 1 [Bufo gargarizans]